MNPRALDIWTAMIIQTNQDVKLTKDYDDKIESSLESSQPTDAEKLFEEKRLVRKLDNRILPITCLLYFFACEPSFACSVIYHSTNHLL